MRPKGTKDKKKRKIKKILKGPEEIEIIKRYKEGLSLNDLSKLYNVSVAALSVMFKTRNIKCRVNNADVAKWTKINVVDQIKDNVCGIYVIYFINTLNTNDIKLYIGSSVNIKARLKEHIKRLKLEKHDSAKLLSFFKDSNYVMNMGIMQECDPDSVLEKESKAIMQFDTSCLINTWQATTEESMLPWLKKAITLKSYKDYTINSNGCWESKYCNKKGYAILKVVAFRDWGAGQKKYLYSHRVAYWEKYGEYPELIRHKCNNSKCKNPDHLEKGNHRDNALDKRGDFPNLFEQKWLEFKADPLKLSEYFSYRWKANQKWKNNKISYAIYSWEKKLNLRKKYPEVLDANDSRRFSIQYQKLGRSKKKLCSNRTV